MGYSPVDEKTGLIVAFLVTFGIADAYGFLTAELGLSFRLGSLVSGSASRTRPGSGSGDSNTLNEPGEFKYPR